MSVNFIEDGVSMSVATATGLSSGDPYMMGDYRPCVLEIDAGADTPYTATVRTTGVFDLSVKAINGSGNSAVALFDAIFYTAGDTPKLSKKSTGDLFGVALEIVATGTTDTIKILLNPVFITAASVDAAALASDAVTTVKILDDNVTTAKILDGNVTAGKLASDSVTTIKILDDNVTTAKILDANVTSAKLASGAGVAALLTAGLGGSESVVKTDAATDTIVAAHGTKDRACLVLVVVDETYAIGTGTLPTIKIGEDDTIEKCVADTVLDDEAAGTVLAYAFTNTATKKIIVTSTAAVGDSTGGCSITVLAIPTT